MDGVKGLVRITLLLTTFCGFVSGDFCTDYANNVIYCSYGCCGWDDSYCCGYTWSDGGIAGTVVGIFFFCLFIALIVICCRRRYRAPAVVHNYPGNASIAVVSTQQTVNSGASTGYAMPATQYPNQKPTQGYPGQPPAPGYPGQYPQVGVHQPPAYSP